MNTADYYPFGMMMQGRGNQSIDYRYAYNGMEADKEVKGYGNSYTTEFRQYDPRLGRWLSLDPLKGKYPMMSPYVAFNNNPIFFIDPLGLEGGPAKELFQLPEIDETDPNANDNGVVITANRSTSSDQFNKWLEKNGGADFIREVQNALFESKKVQGNNNNLGSLAYGNNSLGKPNYSSIRLGMWKQEAEREAIYTIHALYAEEMSGVDPNGLNYLLNPVASGRFDLWLLDAASSSYEENMIKAGMLFDVIVLAIPIAKGVKTSIKAGKQILRRSISMGSKKGVSNAAKGVGTVLRGVDDVMINPQLPKGQTLDEVKSILGNSNGWVNDVMRRSTTNPNGGWVLREMNKAGTDFTGRMIQYHPGTPRHFGGAPYWKVSSGSVTSRIPVNP